MRLTLWPRSFTPRDRRRNKHFFAAPACWAKSMSRRPTNFSLPPPPPFCLRRSTNSNFLQEKLLDVEGDESKQQLHRQIAAGYETLGGWQQAVQQYLAIQEWPGVSRVLAAQNEEGINSSA